MEERAHLRELQEQIEAALRDSFHPERPGTLVCTGAGTRVPCVSGRTLRSGEALLAALCPDAFSVCGAAVEALRGAGSAAGPAAAARARALFERWAAGAAPGAGG